MTVLMTTLLTVLGLTAGTDVGTRLDRAFYLFENRHLDQYNLGASKAIAESVLALDPHQERALQLMSQVWMTYGDDAAGKNKKLGCYQKGMAYAETLMVVNERNPEGHFWFVGNYGRIGQTRGVLNSLFMVPRLKKEMLRTIELDPRYAAGYDALGVLYYELPGFAGGDLAKSVEYFNKGIAIDPNYTLIHVDLVKTLLKKGDRTAARAALQAALAITQPTHPADHFLDDRPEAERLLRELDKK